MSTDKPNDTLVQKTRILDALLKNLSTYTLMMQGIEGKNSQDYCLTGKSKIDNAKRVVNKHDNVAKHHKFYNFQEVFDSSVVNYVRLHYNNLRFIEPISEKRAEQNLLQLDQIAVKRNIDRHLQELEVQNQLLPKFLRAVNDFNTRVENAKQEIINADLADQQVVAKINFLLDKYLDRLNLLQTTSADYPIKLNNLLLVFLLQLLQAQTQAEQDPNWHNWGTDFLNFVKDQEQLLELSLIGKTRLLSATSEEREVDDEKIAKLNTFLQRLLSSDPFTIKEDLTLLYKFFRTDKSLEINNPRGLKSSEISELSKQLSLAQALKDSLIYSPAYNRAEISYITRSLKLGETGYTTRINPGYYRLTPFPWTNFVQSLWYGQKAEVKRFFQFDNYSFNWRFDEQESLVLAIRNPDALKEYYWMQDLFVTQYVMQKFHYPLVEKDFGSLNYPYRKFYFKQEWQELENGVYGNNNLYPYSVKANFYTRNGKINNILQYLDNGVRFNGSVLSARKLGYSFSDDLVKRKDFKIKFDSFFVKGAYAEFKQAEELEQGKLLGKFVYPQIRAKAILEHDTQAFNVPQVQYYAQLAQKTDDLLTKIEIDNKISYVYLEHLTNELKNDHDPFIYKLLHRNLSYSEQVLTGNKTNNQARDLVKYQEVYYRKQDIIDTFGLYGFNYQAYVAHRNGKQVLRFKNYLENPLNFRHRFNPINDQVRTMGESILVPIYTPKLFNIPIFNGEEGLLAKSFISEEQYFKGQNSFALIYSRFESNITYDLFETLSSREVEVLSHRYYQEPSLQLAGLNPEGKIFANTNVELAVSLYQHLRGIFSALNRIKYYSDKLPKANFLRAREKTSFLNPSKQLLPADLLVLELSLGVKALATWHHPQDLPMSELNIYPGYKYSLTAEVELNQREFYSEREVINSSQIGSVKEELNSGYFLLQPKHSPSNFAIVHLSLAENSDLVKVQTCFSNRVDFNPSVLRTQYYSSNSNSYLANNKFLTSFRTRIINGAEVGQQQSVQEFLSDNERCFTLATALYDLDTKPCFYGKNLPGALQWKFCADFTNEPLDSSWFTENLSNFTVDSYQELASSDSTQLANLMPMTEEYFSTSLKPLTSERYWQKLSPVVEKFTLADFREQYSILGKIENLQISASEGVEGDIIRSSHIDNLEYDRYLSFVGANSLKNLLQYFVDLGYFAKLPTKFTAEQWLTAEQNFIYKLAGITNKATDAYKRLLNVEWYQRLDRQYVNFIPLGARPVKQPTQRLASISYHLVFPSYSYLSELHKKVLKSPVEALKLYGNNLWLNYNYLAPLTALAVSKGQEEKFTKLLYNQVGDLLFANQSEELLNNIALNIAQRINKLTELPYKFTKPQLARFNVNLNMLKPEKE